MAEYLKISKAAVSRAMAKLKEDKYLIMDDNGYIALTEKGRDIEAIKKFLKEHE